MGNSSSSLQAAEDAEEASGRQDREQGSVVEGSADDTADTGVEAGSYAQPASDGSDCDSPSVASTASHGDAGELAFV